MGGQIQLLNKKPDSEDNSETGGRKGKASPCCKDAIESPPLSPNALDSYRGDLLAVLPFEGGPNAFNSIDECE